MFTHKHGKCPNITHNNVPIPTSDTISYLGLILDKRLEWNEHQKTKRLTLNTRVCMLRHLLIKNKHITMIGRFATIRVVLYMSRGLFGPAIISKAAIKAVYNLNITKMYEFTSIRVAV